MAALEFFTDTSLFYVSGFELQNKTEKKKNGYARFWVDRHLGPLSP